MKIVTLIFLALTGCAGSMAFGTPVAVDSEARQMLAKHEEIFKAMGPEIQKAIDEAIAKALGKKPEVKK